MRFGSAGAFKEAPTEFSWLCSSILSHRTAPHAQTAISATNAAMICNGQRQGHKTSKLMQVGAVGSVAEDISGKRFCQFDFAGWFGEVLPSFARLWVLGPLQWTISSPVKLRMPADSLRHPVPKAWAKSRKSSLSFSLRCHAAPEISETLHRCQQHVSAASQVGLGCTGIFSPQSTCCKPAACLSETPPCAASTPSPCCAHAQKKTTMIVDGVLLNSQFSSRASLARSVNSSLKGNLHFC